MSSTSTYKDFIYTFILDTISSKIPLTRKLKDNNGGGNNVIDDSNNVNILSFNIGGVFQDSERMLERRCFLYNEKERYDIIIFQEVFFDWSRNPLKSVLKDWYFIEMKDDPFSLYISGGVCVFSKYPIFLMGDVIFNKSYGYDFLSQKGAIAVKTSTSVKKDIIIVCTHFQDSRFDKDLVIRKSQLKQVHDLALYTNARFIIGDFNIEALTMENICDSYWNVQHTNGYTTFNGKNIDYMLSNDVSCNCEIKIVHKAATLSDHYPVNITLSFL